MKQKNSFGRWGEDLAVAHLRGLGWTILDRNWRCRAGEVDIVAHEPGPPLRLVIVEVKTKAGARFGDPLEAITVAKAARLGRLALWWQRAHMDTPGSLRLDAVGITKTPGMAPVIRHVRGLA
ncbi:MAG: YraN family protein [Propionibacteriaceae bacterium]|nr:YraN family protein [Propionibacteriaceae bacterium]